MPTKRPMAPADAAWLHMDRPTNLMIVNSVLWCAEPVDWDALRARFMEPLRRLGVGEATVGH